MPFVDEAAQNAALDALWGAGHGASMPSTFQVGLLDGDPSDGGAELDSDGGYARITRANNATTWLPADAGVKSSVPLPFPDPTDAWSADADYWGIYVAGVLFDYGPLSDTLQVTGAGTGPRITLARYFDPTADDN